VEDVNRKTQKGKILSRPDVAFCCFFFGKTIRFLDKKEANVLKYKKT
jgi:hypothetical protein